MSTIRNIKFLTLELFVITQGFLFTAHAYNVDVYSESDWVTAWSTGGVDRVTLAANLNLQISATLANPKEIMSVNGQGAQIDGNGQQIMRVGTSSPGNTNGDFGRLKNITLTNGLAGAGAALFVSGNLSGGIAGVRITDNVNNAWAIPGGAIAVYGSMSGSMSGGITDSVFDNNTGAGNFGGALGVRGNFSGGIYNTTFSNNQITRTLAGGSTTSHYGGAVGIQGILDGGIHHSLFINNVISHPVSSNTNASGGALAAYGINGGIHDSEFISNHADHFGGAIEILDVGSNTGYIAGGIHQSRFIANSTLWQGGAIRVAGVSGISGGIYHTEFDANNAGLDGGAILLRTLSGGIHNSSFTNNVATRYGGAIFILGNLNGGIHRSSFRNNSSTGSATGYEGGLGGAIVSGGRLDIIDSRFTNNIADTSHMGDRTSGRGGAIFHYTGAPSQTFNIYATDAAYPVYFSGNRHNPAGAGLTPNSIFFGTRLTATVLAQGTLGVTLNAAPNTIIEMFDPIASQEDGLQDSGGNNYTALTVNIDKTGQGTWLLGGLNDMRSAGHWTISEGTLLLLDQAPGASGTMFDTGAAHIRLSHTDSSMTLKNGAQINVTLGSTPHQISATDITFENGSTSSVKAMYGEPFVVWSTVPAAPIPVLKLNANNTLINAQDLTQEAGILRIGVYDYNYELFWDALYKDTLYLQVTDLINPLPPSPRLRYNAQRAGVSATTAPGAIAFHSDLSAKVVQRNEGRFLHTDNTVLGSHLWAIPTYGYTRQDSGLNRVGYRLRNPGIAIGVDRQISASSFVGIAGNFNKPSYESPDADIRGDDKNFLLYAATQLPWQTDLTVFAGYGRVDYRQTRRVHGSTYHVDNSFEHYRVGLNIGQYIPVYSEFSLRPFLTYEYLHIDTSRYNEGSGTYALDVDGYEQNLQQLRFGSGLDWRYNQNALLSAQAYYTILWGNRAGQTAVRFTQNPSVTYQSLGNSLDSDLFGLSLGSSWTLKDRLNMFTSYAIEKGRHTTNHQLSVNMNYRW